MLLPCMGHATYSTSMPDIASDAGEDAADCTTLQAATSSDGALVSRPVHAAGGSMPTCTCTPNMDPGARPAGTLTNTGCVAGALELWPLGEGKCTSAQSPCMARESRGLGQQRRGGAVGQKGGAVPARPRAEPPP